MTQLVREVQHIGPDGQPVMIDPYNPYGEYTGQPHSTGTYGRNGQPPGQPRFANYEHIAEGVDYRTHSPAAAAYGRTGGYGDYDAYPGHLSGAPSNYAYQPGPAAYGEYPDMQAAGGGAVPMYGERPPTPPSPSEQSESPLPHHARGISVLRAFIALFLPKFPNDRAFFTCPLFYIHACPKRSRRFMFQRVK